jgi:hypothetical protein
MSARFLMTQLRLMVQPQDQSETLNQVLGQRTLTNSHLGLEAECFGKNRVDGRQRTWHGGSPFRG